MKKTLLFFMLILSTITSCNQTSSYSSYNYYSTEEELYNTADIVIEGKVLKNYVEDININADIENSTADDIYTYTISEIEVIEVLKGSLNKNDVIKIKQFGTNDSTVKNSGGYYRKSSKYLFYLADFGSEVPMEALNPQQGNIEIENNKLILTGEGKEIFKESNFEKFKIKLKEYH